LRRLLRPAFAARLTTPRIRPCARSRRRDASATRQASRSAGCRASWCRPAAAPARPDSFRRRRRPRSAPASPPRPLPFPPQRRRPLRPRPPPPAPGGGPPGARGGGPEGENPPPPPASAPAKPATPPQPPAVAARAQAREALNTLPNTVVAVPRRPAEEDPY